MFSRPAFAGVVALIAVQATAQSIVIPPKQAAAKASCMLPNVAGGRDPNDENPMIAYTIEQATRCKGWDSEASDSTCATSSCCTSGGAVGAAVDDEDGCASEAINSKDNLYNFEAWGGQKNCAVTGMKPREPRSLSFCHKFNERACCAPVMDDENTAMFNMLTGVGLSCRIRGDIREDPLAQWYCMNCDPDQPSYVRDAPHDPIDPDCNGDDDGCGSSPSEGRDQTLLVCEDWAESSFGKDPILEGPNGRFDLCGLLKSSPCLDGAGNAIPDRDPYTCGDDLVIPSSYIISNVDGTVNTRMSLEAFMNVDSMGPPLLNEGFYFKIVPRVDENGAAKFCDEDDLITDYAALNVSAGARPQPNCLRTKDQLTETTYTFGSGADAMAGKTYQSYYCATSDAGEDCDALDCSDAAVHMANPCCCAPWIAEACFDSAMGLSPISFATLLVASVAAFTMF